MSDKKKYFDIYAPVFYPAAFIILTTIGISFFYSDSIIAAFTLFQTKASVNAGWFFILCVNVFVIAALSIAFSKMGNIRLGGKEATPDFSTFSWFSMLFSAGIGIGLLFYGVAEPIYHYTNPPLPVNNGIEQARQAMLFTFLHWGIHGWGPYVIIGLALAFFTYNRNLPLTIRSLFYPLIKEKIYGPVGSFIDVLAVVCTLFGLATTLGLGVQQVGAGLNHLFDIPNSVNTQIILITVITLAATTSVVLGLDKGVRFLSVLNMKLTLIFLVVMLFLGPTVFLLDGFIENVGEYLNSIIRVGTYAETFSETIWQHNWTIFYWAWWISWSPFVGMFIARVSKGRTIREFILGVLLVPSVLIFFWMTVFGGTAIFLEANGIGHLAEAVNTDLSTALFVMLEEFPLSSVTSFIGILLVTIFFVTSSDSGSLVIDSITSGGKLDAPVGQRVFWALTEGAVAAALLFAGGLKALQSVVISAGLPFAIVILLVIFSLRKALKEELNEIKKEATRKERQEYNEYLRSLLNENDEEDQ
ncbi:MAG TPA: BCCT family transporter [Saprospiraceae bacterium]|nr:BCCT family transporter [Saprospiraceae bacterium]